MKKTFFSLTLAAASLCSIQGIAQVRMPAPSPEQTIKQSFGTAAIEVVYSRPSAKGRKVFGDLVRYDELWRTGANAATKIKLGEPATIGGQALDTGSYVIYTIPGKKEWEVIINKGLSNWGTDGYKKEEDVARFKTTPIVAKHNTETFTMQFLNLTANTCDLEIAWENTAVRLPIVVNINDKIRQQLEASLAAGKNVYWQGAQFYHEYDNNNAKALEMIDKAIGANTKEGVKPFWMVTYKARIQKAMNDKAGAKASATEALALSEKAGNKDYQAMNKKMLAELK